ncbi:hypothetical protein SH2C18_39640 [Clostridium sediminicola]|uniref:hypothetical protein n=1 Tax=Clostridium sediminicola TaxID=3114879 RepID=UPI0031F1D567
MILGANKKNSLDSIEYCIDHNLFSKEYLQGKVVLLPTTYEDIVQEDIQPLLDKLNPPVQEESSSQ